jgi:hypothetical protein
MWCIQSFGLKHRFLIFTFHVDKNLSFFVFRVWGHQAITVTVLWLSSCRLSVVACLPVAFLPFACLPIACLFTIIVCLPTKSPYLSSQSAFRQPTFLVQLPEDVYLLLPSCRQHSQLLAFLSEFLWYLSVCHTAYCVMEGQDRQGTRTTAG